MKHTRTLILLLMLYGLVSTSYSSGFSGGEKKDKAISKTVTNDYYDFISINNILMWISNNGSTAHNPFTDASGLEWPKGSGMYAIFADGIIWGGRIANEIRVNGSTYRHGLQAGIIKSDGTADNPMDPRYRIYKVRKVDETGYQKLTTTEQIRLRTDFVGWPVRDGAPWIDKNKNGVYEPDFNDWLAKGDASTYDTPWFVGDEVLWFVSNDKDADRSSSTYGTSPVGLEIQTMVWGYEQTGPLGNMIFTKYTLINKGTADLEEAYIAKWSDPDLGEAFDDYVGIDTTLNLGYVYNGRENDTIYGVPPAAGYVFLQGPIISGDPTDVANYNFGLRVGYKNLGVSTFAFYINSSAVYRDPALGVSSGSEQMYNYMSGYLWNRQEYIDPTTGLTVKICLAGDPIGKKGWIDGIANPPGDRRFLMTAGPFTLASGDTQEVIVATIVVRGLDRLSSVDELRIYARFAQLLYNNNFIIPTSADKLENTPEDFRISSVYPHPGDGATTVEYEVQKTGYLALVLIDLGGREVRSVKRDSWHEPGRHIAHFRTDDLPAGLYLLRLSRSGAAPVYRKLIVE